MRAPENVVFDLGGVLIDWDPRYLYRRLIGDEAEMERFLGEVCTPEWNFTRDCGRSFAEGVAEATARDPDRAGLIEAYDRRWIEMMRGDFPDTVAILAELRGRQVPLYALTNWSREKYPHAVERFDWMGWFRDIVVSGVERLWKPERGIYELLLERNGLDAARTLFIDDSAANVEGARACGMQGHHYTGAAGLRAELEGHGLLGPF